MTAMSVSVTVHWNVTSRSLMERRHCCRTTCFRHLLPWTWRQEVFLKRWWLHSRPRGVTLQGTVFIKSEHLSWRFFQCPLLFRMLPIKNSTLSNILSILCFLLVNVVSSLLFWGWVWRVGVLSHLFRWRVLWFILRSIESVIYGICNSVLISK
jgi:hypothetical protein